MRLVRIGWRPGREFVEHGDVEIAVDGHAERARDGRRGHHEDVRVLALAAEREALEHAEFVLLIDDDEAELVRGEAVVEQRVGADDDGPGRLGRGLRFAARGEQIDLAALEAVAPFCSWCCR